jgi:hypothetical protein
MGKPGPLDDGFAIAVRFIFGALFALLIVVGVALYGFPPASATSIAVLVCIVLLCGLASVRYGDHFWERVFKLLYWLFELWHW